MDITYKNLSSLTPIDLQYNFYKNESLKTEFVKYDNGFSFIKLEGLTNFQDITINQNTCLALTTGTSLSSLFENKTKQITLNEIPISLLLESRNKTGYYVGYDNIFNQFSLTLNNNTVFYISLINNSNEIEINVNNQYVQVDEDYPYTVRLSEKTLFGNNLFRQRFKVVYTEKNISLITRTNTGDRFLSISRNDNILRATGTVFNNSVVNNYIFNCINVSTPSIINNFTPNNTWITYFLQPEQQTLNQSLEINKVINNIKNNYLIDFSIEGAIKDNAVNINIANLKTNVTPTGGPSPVNNI